MTLDMTFCAATSRCQTHDCHRRDDNGVWELAYSLGRRALSFADFASSCPAFAPVQSSVDPGPARG